MKKPVRAVIAGIAVLGALGLGGANAATVGGLTARTLLASSASGTVSTPAILSCDNFTGTNGVFPAARMVSIAANCSSRTWTVHLGTFSIATNRAQSSATANANASLDTTMTDGSAQVVLTGMSAASRVGGVVLSHNGSNTYLAAVMTGLTTTTARADLRLYNAGVATTLATLPSTAVVATNTLRLIRAGASVTVRWNNVDLLTYTLSAGELSTLGTAGRAGIFGGNTSVRFDDFLVTNP